MNTTTVTLDLAGFSSRSVRSLRALIVSESVRIDEQMALTKVETDEDGVRVGLRRAQGALIDQMIICDKVAPPLPSGALEKSEVSIGGRTARNSFPVRLEGTRIGEIRTEAHGYRYFPKGQKTGGELFPDLRACARSLGPE